MISMPEMFALILCASFIIIGEAKTREQILNTCLDAKFHKSKPGPESELFKQCTPWKKRSCCTNETASALHDGNLYSLNYDHCLGKKQMSAECRKHFTQDHCFYECSPNVGPWIQAEPHRSWRNERFFGVPLCATDCESWFNDCRADYTCVDNWAMNFDWVAMDGSAGVRGEGTRCPNNASSCKVNVCPRGSSCTTFQQMYGDAKTFCERVWDGSWKVLDDSKPCMRLWFSGKSYNPNDKVAGYYAATARAGPSAAVSSFAIIGLTLGLLYRNI